MLAEEPRLSKRPQEKLTEVYYSQVLEAVSDLLGPCREVKVEVKGAGRESLAEPGACAFVRACESSALGFLWVWGKLCGGLI